MSALDYARSQTGVHEAPPGSNDQAFGAWYGMNGVSWCSIFVAACFYFGAGIDLRGRVSVNYASCVAALAGFARNGWSIAIQNIQPGDVVFYHFSGEHAGANHTGIVESVNRNWLTRRVTSIVAFEGNTSSGSDSHGGIVERRTRNVSLILGVGRVQDTVAPSRIPVVPGTPVSATPGALTVFQALQAAIAYAKLDQLQQGSTGPNVTLLQHGVNASYMPDGRHGLYFGPQIILLAEDGVFGERTRDAVRVFQATRGLPDTGIVDSATWARVYP